MGLSLEQQQAVVAEVTAQLAKAQAVIVAENRGLDVGAVTGLRAKARKSGLYLRVLKNTLARRAVKGTPFEKLSDAVSQRTQEFGVRLAMGAQIGEILRLVLVQGLKVAGMGLGLGLAGALALSVVLQSLLFEMRAQDPLTFFVVVLFLGLVALAACYLPARRATKVDPMVALRCE